jgi:hypothetical protein
VCVFDEGKIGGILINAGYSSLECALREVGVQTGCLWDMMPLDIPTIDLPYESSCGLLNLFSSSLYFALVPNSLLEETKIEAFYRGF